MSALFEDDIEMLVTTCAVDFGPVLWAVFCEICNKQLNEGTQDEALVGKIEAEHQAFHLEATVEQMRALRKSTKRNKKS
jgi:hypothetical protein